MISGHQKQTTILFLCTGNSCRSQMAEGWARDLLPAGFAAFSAGIEKHGLNQLAVKAMKEAGVDISPHKSKTIDELPIAEFDWVITLCGHAQETCPYFPGKMFHHGFEDPPKLALHEDSEEGKMVHYRQVRDEIREFIMTLPELLSTQSKSDNQC